MALQLEEITKKMLLLFFSCYLPKYHIRKFLPILLKREITEEEWVEIYSFVQENAYSQRCRKFFDHDCDGCAIKNSQEFPLEYFIPRFEFWKFWKKKDKQTRDESIQPLLL